MRISQITKLTAIVFILTFSYLNAQNEKFDSLTTLDDRTYKSVTVTKVTASKINIIHESGATKILLSNLAEELQKKFNYDPERAEEEINQDLETKEEQKAKNLQQQKTATEIKLSKPHIFMVSRNLHDGGLIVNHVDSASKFYVTYRKKVNGKYTGRNTFGYRSAKISKRYYIENYPQAKSLVDKDVFDGLFLKSGTVAYGNNTLTKYRYLAPDPKSSLARRR